MAWVWTAPYQVTELLKTAREATETIKERLNKCHGQLESMQQERDSLKAKVTTMEDTIDDLEERCRRAGGWATRACLFLASAALIPWTQVPLFVATDA